MKRSALVFSWLSWLLVLVAPLSTARAAAVDPHVARLAAAARVWGAVKFLHPWIYTHPIDWDAALIQALPKLRSAHDENELAAAVNDMLRPLGDSATRAEADDDAPAAAPTPPTSATTPQQPWSWPAPGVLRLDARGPIRPLRSQLEPLKQQLAKAKQVIFDLRAASPYDAWERRQVVAPLYPLLIGKPLPLPPSRSIQHSGYRPQSGETSGGFATMMQLGSQEMFQPAPDGKPRRVAFLCNRSSFAPNEALAMQAAGQAVILAQGFGSDELAADTAMLRLGEHHAVQYRTADVVPVGIAPHVDAALPAHVDDAAAIALALTQLRKKPPGANQRAPEPLPMVTWQPDQPYADMKAPAVEYRLLALFRLWNVIDRFYPYKELLDHDWDDVLMEAIPKIEAAEGAVAYRQAILQVAARIDDSHVGVRGGEDPLTVRPAMPPFMTRVIEGQVVVGSVLPVPEAAAFHVGDVVVAVDGQPIAETMARLAPFRAASNATARRSVLAQVAVNGALGSSATFTLRAPDGKTREVTIARKPDWGAPMVWRSGDIVRILDGNIGYVDLDRLDPGGVDAMLDKLGGTRAIVFDMRGYPHGTAWAIAPRLNVKNGRVVSRISRLLVGNADPGARYAFAQDLGPPAAKLYRGATFMLIDERTASQAEHTGLFFEALTGTRFVGSQTVGANGDVTILVLPGNLRMSFSGHDIRHADGRQLQRVGLHPDIEVHPTLKGVQSGRDEVLDRALQLARGAK